MSLTTSVTEVANESSLDRRCILHHRGGDERGDEKISGRFHRATPRPRSLEFPLSPTLFLPVSSPLVSSFPPPLATPRERNGTV